MRTADLPEKEKADRDMRETVVLRGRNKKQDGNSGKKHYSMCSNILYFYRFAYREFPQLALCHLCSAVSSIFLPCFGILMPGIVVAVVEKGELLPGLAVITAAGFVIMLFHAFSGQIWHKIYFWENTWREVLLGKTVLKGMKCHYQYVEYDEYKKVTRRAYQSLLRGDGSISYKMLDLPREILVSTVCFCLYSTVLGLLEPWLVAVLVGLSLVNYGILRQKNRWLLAFRKEFAQSDREINYMNQTFRRIDKAKDIRIFSMTRWLTDFRGKVFQKRTLLEKRNNRRIIAADVLQLLLNVVRNGMAYGYLIHSCAQGHISVSGFLVYFGAITGFSGFITSIADHYSELRLNSEEASVFRMHMDLPEIDDEGEVPEALYRQPAEIRFCDVSFSYGGKKIYDHFNLTIRPGEKIALLGMNGAGKTTLVKLLCGLYRPDEGKILINGVNTANLPKRALYDLFSVVFQEAAVLPYPMGCNLSFRKLEDTDEARVWEALREAELEEVFREKGVTMETFMGKLALEDSVELSGGQVQKLLLARAIYKNGSILVLDEPTSALDPIAESEIYGKYAEISRGRTSLFISHRLASTRFSTRILFLENGRIIEEGTHDQLMALGGSYAHMYEVQSHYYRESGKGEVEEDAE